MSPGLRASAATSEKVTLGVPMWINDSSEWMVVRAFDGGMGTLFFGIFVHVKFFLTILMKKLLIFVGISSFLPLTGKQQSCFRSRN